MKFRKPHLWIAFFATGLVLLAAVVEVRRTAPGPLSAVHEQVPELAGMNDCSACHGGLFSSMGEACLSCHEPIAVQLDRGTGLHGDVGQAVGSQCARCHSEHHGPRFELISRQSFALAGVPDPEAFDHGLVGFDMRGRHLEVDCIGCHAHARDVVLPAGERRFLGLDQDCASCHEDAHEGRMVLDCRSCHGQEAWDQLEPWGHGRVLPLVGGHGDLACAECHDAEGPTSLEALGEGFGVAAAAAPGATAKVLVPADESDDPVAQAMSRRPRGREPRDCTACHESPHMPTLVMRVVADEIDRPGGQCAVCHEAEHTGFREAVVEMVPEHHAATGFQLVPPHDRAACADCHLADAPNFERRHPGRSADDCASCHADPHHGQFDRGPFAAEGCLACHDRRHFEPPAFGAEQHGRVDFPLDGSHLELECAACHGEPLHDGPRPFRGTPAKCEECHEDAHLGAFRRFEVRREPPELGRCAQCHLTTSFDEVPDERFVHGDWTAFPLAGAHAQADCEACHLPRPEPDETGRRFGRAGEDVRPVGPTPDSVQAAPMDPGNRRGHAGVKRDFFGDRLMAGEVGCVDCHADPHGGLFDRPTMPREYGGATGCARCHDETSFRVLPEDFDHRLWTGFALQGAHMDAGCDSCHVRRVRPDAEGRTWGRALGTGCADCHQDPHGGQFLASAGQDCDTCHRAASSFADLRFDHDRDSRFKLGQAHSDVGCESCHEAVDVGGTSIVRYKPIDTECIDCHGVHESVLLRRSGRSR